MARIGVIGIGQMGLAMALRLRDAGHAVTVRDIDDTREALAAAGGAAIAPHPAALAAQCELLIVAVVDAAQTNDVLFGTDGAAAALPAGATVMLCATIAPDDVEAAARRLDALGLAVIDAPMSGGPVRARDGTMSLMLACDDAVHDRWHAVLDRLAAHRFRIGRRPGNAMRTKLVNNLLAAINLAGAAEAMALAERLGLDAALTLDVIAKSSGQSWIGLDRMRRALAGDATPQAAMALLAKDSGLALAMAQAVGAPSPIGSVAAERFAAACRDGLATADDAALWRRQRD